MGSVGYVRLLQQEYQRDSTLSAGKWSDQEIAEEGYSVATYIEANGRKARIVEAKLENLERLANREKAMSIRELRANFESIVARTKVGKVFVASTKMLGKISGGIL